MDEIFAWAHDPTRISIAKSSKVRAIDCLPTTCPGETWARKEFNQATSGAICDLNLSMRSWRNTLRHNSWLAHRDIKDKPSTSHTELPIHNQPWRSCSFSPFDRPFSNINDSLFCSSAFCTTNLTSHSSHQRCAHPDSKIHTKSSLHFASSTLLRNMTPSQPESPNSFSYGRAQNKVSLGYTLILALGCFGCIGLTLWPS